jgi:hypothetical protein
VRLRRKERRKKERRDDLNFKVTEEDERMTCGLVKLERGEGAGFYGENGGAALSSVQVRRSIESFLS